MVLGAKKAIRQVPSKGRISIMKIQNFTVEKRQSVIRAIYGSLFITISIVLAAVDPVNVVTNWVLDMREGRYLYRMFEHPTYELFSDVYLFNYTNVEEFLSGADAQLQVEEIGPFIFQEIRTNENMTIDYDRGVMTMNPKTVLEFRPEKSFAHYKDIVIRAPNIALIAISTLLADKMGYFANAGAYYSISALGPKLFINITAEGLLWGYDDPLVNIANKFLPGWIDFGKIGIMDRFYAQRKEEVEIELRNASRKFSINAWNKMPGLVEQGFTDWNSSNRCNRLRDTYEGLMLPGSLPKDFEIPLFRKQACRVYPYRFSEEMSSDYGFNFNRYLMTESAFNTSSEYACPCSQNCLPDGFVDISSCYYGFPIALSKPHFLDADPEQQAYFRGLKPDPTKHMSVLDLEPVLGVPVGVESNIQVNIAVRMSSGNPITRPLKDRVMPLIWMSMYCKAPPSDIITLLRLRLLVAPPLVIALEVLLLLSGMFLGIQGFHRIWKPQYKLVQKPKEMVRRKSSERRRNSVVLNLENTGFVDEQELAKEAVSLLAITEEDHDVPDLLLNE